LSIRFQYARCAAEHGISAEDRLDILELLGRYFWVVDSCDEGAVLACFTGHATKTESIWQSYRTCIGAAAAGCGFLVKSQSLARMSAG
jgi:hypothetical protein